MTDITELSTPEKSRLLARALGFEKRGTDIVAADGTLVTVATTMVQDGDVSYEWPDFYQAEEMAVAWNMFVDAMVKGGDFGESLEEAWDVNARDIICYPAGWVQKMMLDIVLKQAIEHGRVRIEAEAAHD